MMTAIYNTMLAVPVMNEQSPLEPFLYTAIAVLFPVALMFFLRKKEDSEKRNA